MGSLEDLNLTFDMSDRGGYSEPIEPGGRHIDTGRVPALRSVDVVFEGCQDWLSEIDARKETEVDSLSLVRVARRQLHCAVSYSRKMSEFQPSELDGRLARKRMCNH
jgi:hypothetical protein